MLLRKSCVWVAVAICFAAMPASSAPLDGRKLAFDSTKGNCLACHVISGGAQMGDIGPPLTAMRERFPDRARLRQQIWDPYAFNPQSLMPPFGRHRILTAQEIDAIVAFLYTL